MNQGRLVFVGALVSMPLVLVFALLFFMMQVESDLEASTCLGGADQAAVSVDPSSVPAGPVAGFGKARLVNAAHVMLAAKKLGLSGRDQRIGVMTAIGESGLRVLTHGDAAGPDSLGLFQQRANGAWGTRADRLDPSVSSTNFFKALAKIPDRDLLAPTIAAHRVQRNADPYHYERYWDQAGRVVRALAGVTDTHPVSQTVSDYDLGPVKPQLSALVNALAPKFGIRTVGGYRASATDAGGHPAGLAADFMVPLSDKGITQGNDLAAYAVQNATALQIDYVIWRQQIWSRSRQLEGWRPMSDRGSPTANHFDHVHINVVPGSDGGDVLAAAACVASAAAVDGGWTRPVEGPITSAYGARTHPLTGEPSFHDGNDYGAPCGTPIRAAGSGIVVKAGPDIIYGHQIVIDHGAETLTKYGHMYAKGVLAQVGDQVEVGTTIAQVGSDGRSTGCHLHFTLTVNGTHRDPTTILTATNARALA